ncbi:hypothetical protein, partial [Tsukamurella conjunctivitidis]|uniref:hypothetical protein n=1 Tax=Tsukamurella conjunctivitidis TaxID=2592068 RepID=UPI0019619EFB
DNEQTRELAAALVNGFATYCSAGEAGAAPEVDCTTDPATAFQSFLDSPAGREIQEENRATIEELTSAAEGAGQELEEQLLTRLGQAVQEQVTAHSAELQDQIAAAMQDYMQQATQAYMTQLSGQLSSQIGGQLRQQLGERSAQLSTNLQSALQEQLGSAISRATSQLAGNMAGAMGVDEDALRGAFRFDMDQEELSELLVSMLSSRQASLDANLATLGHA